MSKQSYINYEQAFSDMNNLTKLNQPFKLMFRKEDGSIKLVTKALLRKRTPKSKDAMSSYKFNYIDTVNNTMGSTYIPSLLSVNDKEIIIK